jgi:hypothetical protein
VESAAPETIVVLEWIVEFRARIAAALAETRATRVPGPGAAVAAAGASTH